MKKTVACLAFGLSLLLFGCTKKTTVIQTPEGTATLEQKGNQITIEDKEGKATIGNVNVSEKDLGVPVYPGASQQGGMAVSENSKDASGSYSTAAFTTKDSFEKVTAFYKDKVPSTAKFTNVTLPEGSMSMIEV